MGFNLYPIVWALMAFGGKRHTGEMRGPHCGEPVDVRQVDYSLGPGAVRTDD